MKISKTMAFIICMILIAVMFLVLTAILLFSDKESNNFPIGVFLTAVVAMGTAYLGIDVANNYQKGKNWNQQMYDTEQKAKEDKQ